jgi:hypothetical protein
MSHAGGRQLGGTPLLPRLIQNPPDETGPDLL